MDIEIDLSAAREQVVSVTLSGTLVVQVYMTTVTSGSRPSSMTEVARTTQRMQAGNYTIGELVDGGYLPPRIQYTGIVRSHHMVDVGGPIAVGYCISIYTTCLTSDPDIAKWYGTLKAGPNSCSFGPGVDIDLGGVQATNGPGESELQQRYTSARCATISTVRIYVAGGGTVPTNVPGLNAEIYINDQLGEYKGQYDRERELRIGAKVVWADGSAFTGGAITAQGIIVTEIM